jgi:hypothetical protein
MYTAGLISKSRDALSTSRLDFAGVQENRALIIRIRRVHPGPRSAHRFLSGIEDTFPTWNKMMKSKI